VDPDNIIILGTPSWSQGVVDAADDPVDGTNLMYTLHFYSCSHTGWLRENTQEAYDRGLPIFVTEWGATHSDGGLDGIVCEDEAVLWHDLLDQLKLGWTAWKLDVCNDSSCILASGASRDGPWNELHGHGDFVISRMRN
jgi:aryl-phospho-beta-D-glucosidase BglC (GH1 family)